MSYITKIFERLDLQQIREFLLYGTECAKVSEEDYKQRLETVRSHVSEVIDNFPGEVEKEKVEDSIYDYVNVTQDVYMEIGMKCGAVLAMQLLENSRKRE